jgi:hypothetical protein
MQEESLYRIDTRIDVNPIVHAFQQFLPFSQTAPKPDYIKPREPIALTQLDLFDVSFII